MIVLFQLLLTIPVSLLRGFVLSYLWLWFVSPLGVPAIGIVEAVGLSWVVSMFTYRFARKDDTTVGIQLMNVVVQALIALLFGYVWHLFL